MPLASGSSSHKETVPHCTLTPPFPSPPNSESRSPDNYHDNTNHVRRTLRTFFQPGPPGFSWPPLMVGTLANTAGAVRSLSPSSQSPLRLVAVVTPGGQKRKQAQDGQRLCLKSCSKGAWTGPHVCLIAESLILISILNRRVNLGAGHPVAKGPGMPPLRERPWMETGSGSST